MTYQFDPILGTGRDGKVTLAEQQAGFNSGTAAQKAAFQSSVSGDRAKLTATQQAQQTTGATTALLNAARTGLVDPVSGATISLGYGGGGGYVAPTLLNGWENFGFGYNPAGYMLDGLGFVHLRGLIKLGGLHSPAFQLPPGCRPAYNEYMATVADNAFASIATTAAGDVIPWDGVNTWFSLDGVTFRAAQ